MQTTRTHLFSFLFLLFSFQIAAQTERPKPSATSIAAAPEWAQQMYSEIPNIHEVDSGYMEWRKDNPIGHTYHTKFYKTLAPGHRQRRFIGWFLDTPNDGARGRILSQLADNQRRRW